MLDSASPSAWRLFKTTTWRANCSVTYEHVNGIQWRTGISLVINPEGYCEKGQEKPKYSKIALPIAFVNKDIAVSDAVFVNESGRKLQIATPAQSAVFLVKVVDEALSEEARASASAAESEVDAGERASAATNEPSEPSASSLRNTALSVILFQLFRQIDLLRDPDDNKNSLAIGVSNYGPKLKRAICNYIDKMKEDPLLQGKDKELSEAKAQFESYYSNSRLFRYFVQMFTSKRALFVVLENETLDTEQISGSFIESRNVLMASPREDKKGTMHLWNRASPFGQSFDKEIDFIGMGEHVKVTVKAPENTYFAPMKISGGVSMVYQSELKKSSAPDGRAGQDERPRWLNDPQARIQGSITPSQVTVDSAMRWSMAKELGGDFGKSLNIEEGPYRNIPSEDGFVQQRFFVLARLTPTFKGQISSALAFFFVSIVAALFLYASITTEAATCSGAQSGPTTLQALFVVAPIVFTVFLSRRKRSFIESAVSLNQRVLIGVGVFLDIVAVLAYVWRSIGASAMTSLSSIPIVGGPSYSIAEQLGAWYHALVPNVTFSDKETFLSLGVLLGICLFLYLLSVLIVKGRKACWTRREGAFCTRVADWKNGGELDVAYSENNAATTAKDAVEADAAADEVEADAAKDAPAAEAGTATAATGDAAAATNHRR